MTAAMAGAAAPKRSTGKSALAVFVGFLIVFVLSLGTDQVLHVLNVYPAILAFSAFLTAWLGGRLFTRSAARR